MKLLQQEKTLAQIVYPIYKTETNLKNDRKVENALKRHAFRVMLRKHTDLTLSDVGAITSCDHSNVVHAEKIHDANLMREDYRRYYSKASLIYEMEKAKKQAEAFEEKDYLMMLAEIKHLQLVNRQQEKRIAYLTDEVDRLTFYKK